MAVKKQESEHKSRQQIHKDHDAKRKSQPKLNAIRNPPKETIFQLEELGKKFGNKKEATIQAIALLYEKTFNKS